MNWKKTLKYSGLTLLTLLLISPIVIYFGMKSSMKQFYGANTKVVDVSQFKPTIGPALIKNAFVLSPDCKEFIEGQNVLIEDGRIVRIDSSVSIPLDVELVDGSGKYLIPGLIDSHVHLFYSPNDLLLYIANGVTEIREMMGSEGRLELKREIQNGRIGPKMWVMSPPLGSSGSIQNRFISWTRQARIVNDSESAEKAVQEFKDQGYDGIKIYSHVNKEAYNAACQKADKIDFPVVGHIPWEIELEDLWKCGQSEIGHVEELMNALRRQFGNINGKEDEFLNYVREQSNSLAQLLIQKDIAVTSTLSLVDGVYRQKFDLENVLRNVELSYANVGIVEGVQFGDSGFGWLPETNLYRLPKDLNEDEIAGRKKFWFTYSKACEILGSELAAKGVQILAGTDANLPTTVPGFSLHDELVSLNEMGMSTAQVLQSATIAAADYMKSKTGRIQIGFEANMVLLDKNPLEDIRNTRSINTVFSNGKVYDRKLLDELLASVKAANDEGRTKDISIY